MAIKSIDSMKMLIVDDKQKEANAIKEALEIYGFTKENIETLPINSLNELIPKTKDRYSQYDILFFDLKFDKTVEEGLHALETLISEESHILLTAVYIVTSSPAAAKTNAKIKALMVDVIEKPQDPQNVSEYMIEFENKKIKETIGPIVDTYSDLKEKLKQVNAYIEISNKLDTILNQNEVLLENLTDIKDKIGFLSLSSKAILALLPDTMGSKKKAKAKKYIEENINSIDFPDSLKREGVFRFVKDIIVDSFKDGLKEESTGFLKENFIERIKEELLNKSKEEGFDTDEVIYAGMYLARNTLVDVAKYVGVNLDA